MSIKLLPHALADSLELWALRREKVLAILDIRAAKQARQIARECRSLTKSPSDHPAWEFQWMTIRAAAAALLERHRSVPPPPNGLLPQGGSVPPRAVSDTHTIHVEPDDAPHSERPTRIAAPVWTWNEGQRKVA